MSTFSSDDGDKDGNHGGRRVSLKSSAAAHYAGAKSASAQRRARALERTKHNRRDALAYARAVVATRDGGDGGGERTTAAVVTDTMSRGDGSDMDADGSDVATTSQTTLQTTTTSAAMALTMPEWMWDDVPYDLSTKWYVRSRPRGARCLVVASKGKTTARSARDGRTTAKFQSALPGGSARTMRGRGSDCFCILDCVYAEDEKARKDSHHQQHGGGGAGRGPQNRRGTYYVLDVMAWNGAAMYDCDAEFRFFWAHTRLTQECEACEQPDDAKGREFSFAFTPWYDADADGVRAAYAENIGVERDGLLFYHKEAAYDVGVTPLVLLWRDAVTSRFFLRDEGAAAVLARAGVPIQSVGDAAFDGVSPQIVALAKSSDGAFFITGDEPPVVIAACDNTPCASTQVVAHAVSLAPGCVGRFLVGACGFDVDIASGFVRAADIAYLGPKPQATSSSPTSTTANPNAADILSKILFHARARSREPPPLDIRRLVDGAARSAADDTADDTMIL